MRFINELHEGDRVSGIYLCKQKQSAMTKNGKPYDNVILQDKTGVLDGKIWDPNSLGIDDFDTLDYIDVVGDVTTFAGAMQLNIKRVRKASEGEYNPADYLPVSENSTDDMYGQILNMIKTVKNEYLSALLNKLFVEDKEFLKSFQEHSAAKTVHHGFIGGLMEHTLSVTKLCDYMANAYPLLKRDLLITAALLHDVGKTKELSSFPLNDYTDEGQLLGHIIIGAQMIHDLAKEIPNFPETLENQLVHCILAHHGELEYGSPKKPALAEAVALNLADNTCERTCSVCGEIEKDDSMSLLSVSGRTAKAGDTVSVTISLANNPGIAALAFRVSYPKGAMTLESAVAGGLFGSATLNKSTMFLFDNAADVTENGTLLTLTFRVSDMAVLGEYRISLEIVSCNNAAEERVVICGGQANIEVGDILHGDVNGDGVVDTLDITRLRRYLAEESVDLFPGADMNGDGAVDIEDLTCLRRYLVEAATGLGG